MVDGVPHTAKRSKGSIVVSLGVPPSPYIKEWRRGRGSATLGAPHKDITVIEL